MQLNRPSRLPKARDRLAAMMATKEIRAVIGMESPGLAATTAGMRYHAIEALPTADLYWVTEPMSKLAQRSGVSLEPTLVVDEAPSPTGLLVWDGGVPGLNVWLHDNDREPHVMIMAAATWCVLTVKDGEQLLAVFPLIATASLRGADADAAEQSSPLLPAVALFVDASGSFSAIMTSRNAAIAKTIRATWLLMQQPNLAEYQPVEVDRDVRRSYSRAQRPAPAVKLVTLRRPPGAGSDSTGTGRDYAHQWIVNGHWRNQPWGTARSQRRRQWIAPYIKGPEDAPMLEQTVVKVWRR